MQNHKLLAGVILCLMNISFIYAVSIDFYGYNDEPIEKEFYYGSKSADSCQNFIGNSRPAIKSIATDTCVVVYGHPNCKGFWSKKFLPSSKFCFPNHWLWYIGSFHACNNTEGGSQLNVDITKYFKNGTMEVPPTLKSYSNVRNCVNVPKYVQRRKKWSINNHANDILAYSEPNCSEAKFKARLIPAGHDVDSREMGYYSNGNVTWKPTLSFGPAPNSKNYKTPCSQKTIDLPTVPTRDSQEWIGLNLLNKLCYNIPLYLCNVGNSFRNNFPK